MNLRLNKMQQSFPFIISKTQPALCPQLYVRKAFSQVFSDLFLESSVLLILMEFCKYPVADLGVLVNIVTVTMRGKISACKKKSASCLRMMDLPKVYSDLF